MEIGGLIAEVFKVILGNPDILTGLVSFTFFIAFLLMLFEIYKYITD